MKDGFSIKKVIDICGTLDTNQDGELIIVVETKDNISEYLLKDIIKQMIGTQVRIKNEILELDREDSYDR